MDSDVVAEEKLPSSGEAYYGSSVPHRQRFGLLYKFSICLTLAVFGPIGPQMADLCSAVVDRALPGWRPLGLVFRGPVAYTSTWVNSTAGDGTKLSETALLALQPA